MNDTEVTPDKAKHYKFIMQDEKVDLILFQYVQYCCIMK